MLYYTGAYFLLGVFGLGVTANDSSMTSADKGFAALAFAFSIPLYLRIFGVI